MVPPAFVLVVVMPQSMLVHGFPPRVRARPAPLPGGGSQPAGASLVGLQARMVDASSGTVPLEGRDDPLRPVVLNAVEESERAVSVQLGVTTPVGVGMTWDGGERRTPPPHACYPLTPRRGPCERSQRAASSCPAKPPVPPRGLVWTVPCRWRGPLFGSTGR